MPAAEKYHGKANSNILQLHGISKVDVIISLFDQGELKVKDIAKQMGLENQLELAKFMKSKGYQWEPVAGNYVKSDISIIQTPQVDQMANSLSTNASLAEVLQNLMPILQNLNPQSQIQVKQEILTERRPSINMKIPRYNIRGAYTTKGMRMAIVLDELMRQYCKEKNLNQRELIEVAMVEFFMKYGYAKNIEMYLYD